MRLYAPASPIRTPGRVITLLGVLGFSVVLSCPIGCTQRSGSQESSNTSNGSTGKSSANATDQTNGANVVVWKPTRRSALKFHAVAGGITVGTTTADLVNQLGKPDVVVSARSLPGRFARAPINNELQGLLALNTVPATGPPLVDGPLAANYRNYVLFTIWAERAPRVAPGEQYSEQWFTGPTVGDCDVHIYTDTRFGSVLERYTAYMYFTRDQRIVSISHVWHWETEHFDANGE